MAPLGIILIIRSSLDKAHIALLQLPVCCSLVEQRQMRHVVDSFSEVVTDEKTLLIILEDHSGCKR